MKKHVILSAMGRDRVGVADDLAIALAGRGITIEDSRMTSLRGRFTLLVQLYGEEKDLTRLRKDLGVLSKNLGFDLDLETMAEQGTVPRAPRFMIESFSRNPAGLEAVTGLLKRYDVSIEELQTDAYTDPFSSRIKSYMKIRITVPPTISRDTLREEFRTLERERGLEFVIKEELEPVGV